MMLFSSKGPLLPPLIKTQAEVVERNTVDIQPLPVGSVYSDQLRSEVQKLPEFHFASAQFLFCSFTLSDVDHSAGVLNEIAGWAEYRMTNAVNVPDGAARMHNTIINFLIQLVMYGPRGRFPEHRL